MHSGVFGIAPNSGWKGSRRWKSMGPFLTCTPSTFGGGPVGRRELVNACLARSSGISCE